MRRKGAGRIAWFGTWLASCWAVMPLMPVWAQQQSQGRITAIEEVIVSAQKRENTLQDVPISLVAFDASDLEKIGAEELEDAANYVPNVMLRRTTGSLVNYALGFRGIAAGEPALSRDNPLALYVDGVYLGRLTGNVFEVGDLQRIEVLRGPQGTLAGRNAVGGAINLITATPDSERLSFKQHFGVGEDGYNRSYTNFNLPLGDTGALRFTFVRNSHDGYLTNFAREINRYGELDDLGREDSTAGRLSLFVRSDDKLSMQYVYDFAYRDNLPNNSQFISLSPDLATLANPNGVNLPIYNRIFGNASRDYLNFTNISIGGEENADINGHALTFSWDFNERQSLKSITSYREVDRRVRGSDNGSFPLSMNENEHRRVFDYLGFQYRNLIDTNGDGVLDSDDGNVRNNVPATFTHASGRTGGAPVSMLLSDLSSDQQQFSQEFQFLGEAFDQRFRYVVGFYYFQESGGESVSRYTSLPNSLAVAGVSKSAFPAVTIAAPSAMIINPVGVAIDATRDEELLAAAYRRNLSGLAMGDVQRLITTAQADYMDPNDLTLNLVENDALVLTTGSTDITDFDTETRRAAQAVLNRIGSEFTGLKASKDELAEAHTKALATLAAADSNDPAAVAAARGAVFGAALAAVGNAALCAPRGADAAAESTSVGDAITAVETNSAYTYTPGQESDDEDEGGTSLAQGCASTLGIYSAPNKDSRIDNKSYAFYMHGDLSLTEQVDLSLGFRATRDTRDASIDTNIPMGGTGLTKASGKWSHNDFEAALGWEMRPGVRFFVKGATAYLSGGFNTDEANAAAFSRDFSPEEILSIEAGIKSDWFDRRLRLNATVFDMDYEDRQVPLFITNPLTGANTRVVNADQTNQGVEIELSWVPFSGMLMQFNYGYTDAEFDSFPVVNFVPTDPSTRLPNTGPDATPNFAPENTASIVLQYELPRTNWGNWTLRVDALYQDEFTILPNYPVDEDDATAGDRTVVNARLTWERSWGDHTFRISFWGRNIADEEYRTFPVPVLFAPGFQVNTASWGEPRQTGVDFVYEF